MNETKKRKKEIAIRSNVVQEKLKLVKQDGKDFVEVNDEQGNTNLFEVIKKGAQTFVKVAGAVILFNLFTSCVSTQSLNRFDGDFDDLSRYDSGKKNERTVGVETVSGDLPAQVADGSITIADIKANGASTLAAQTMVKNGIVNDLNGIATTSLRIVGELEKTSGLLPVEDVITRTGSNAELKRADVVASLQEILVAIADTATTSNLNSNRVGVQNGVNQTIQMRDASYRATGKRPNWIDGLTLIVDKIFFHKVSQDVNAGASPTEAQKFAQNIQVMRNFAANPTQFPLKNCQQAITEIAELLSRGYDLDYSTMHSLTELMGVILTEIENAKVIEKQPGMVNIRYLQAPAPQIEHHSGNSSDNSPTNNGGGNTTPPPSGPTTPPPSGPTTPPEQSPPTQGGQGGSHEGVGLL